MSSEKDDIDALIEASQVMANLAITDEHKPGVKAYLSVAKNLVELLEAVPLDENELALTRTYTPPEHPDDKPA